MDEIDDDVPLPPVHDAVLDDTFVERLFADVGACTELLSVSTKGGAERPAEAQSLSLSLERAQHALATGAVHGVQLRYRHEGREWCDTILRQPAGYRVVRIEAQGPRD